MGECSLYETATQEVITMYNDEFNNNDMYRFTNREVPRDDYAPAPRQENTYTAPVKKQGFFRRTWVKVTALVLACAVVGGAAGYGGAALAKGGSGSGTAISESDRTVTAVEVKKVDGKTKMQPAEVYASTVNSTVSINCSTTTNVFGQTTQSASSGSGFIISEDGYIVTNYHVISGASSVKVTLYNGDTYDATVIGGDSDYDVAVLKINAAGLTPVTLGNSADVNVGDSVLAIGNPLGELTFSMSGGYVSSCNRAINVDGTAHLAAACKAQDCKMMYISTDYVFNGQGQTPWQPDCKDYQPLNYYGETKLGGELAVSSALEKYFIVRIAWVFGLNGKNFIKTMLQLGKTHDKLRVVCDQIGTPTYTLDLARLLADMIESDKYGYYHATNEGGYISWYEFACEIFRQAGLPVQVDAVTTAEYGASKAARPSNSRLDKSKLAENGFTPLPDWKDALSRYLKELGTNQ